MRNQENNINVISYDDKYEDDFVRVYQSVYSEKPYCESFTEDDVKEVADQTDMYLLISEDDEAIGFVGGMPLSEFYKMHPEEELNLKAGVKNAVDAYYIAELGISREKQRRGLGKELFGKFISMAESKGYKAFVLCTADKNNKAQRLYENFGFQRCRDEKENVIYRKVTQLRTNGKEESDNRPYYVRSSQ